MKIKELHRDMKKGLEDDEVKRLTDIHKSADFYLKRFVLNILVKHYRQLLNSDESEDTLMCPNLEAKLQQNIGGRKAIKRLIQLLSDHEV